MLQETSEKMNAMNVELSGVGWINDQQSSESGTGTEVVV